MKEHLYEIDLMRTFIILGVICVHNFSFYNLFNPFSSAPNFYLEMGLTALHFTRESFMFITGLVLFITYYNKPFKATSFWARRFKLIAVPYIFFTVAYILFSGTYLKNFVWTAPHLFKTISTALLTGNQFFLYYLLISMQLYIVFPLFLKWMKKTTKWHIWILVGSFVIEIFLMWLNKAYLDNLNLSQLPIVIKWLVLYRDRNLLTYEFWFIAGALTAIYYQPVKAYVVAHSRLVYTSFFVMLAILWIHYAIGRLVLHQDYNTADLVLQPIMVPFSLTVTAVIWRLGIAWADNRHKASMLWFSGFVKTVAAASFGVFLIHPFALHYVEEFIYYSHPNLTMRMILLPLSILFVYGTSTIVSHMISKIPLFSYVVGQKSKLPKWRTDFSQSA